MTGPKKTLLICFLVFPLFIYRTKIEEFFPDIIFNLWRLMSALLILFYYLGKRRLPLKSSMSVIAPTIWLLVTSMINNGNIHAVVMRIINVVIIVMVFDLFQNKPKILINSLLICFEITIYINAASMVLFPAGFAIGQEHEKEWILGHYITLYRWFLPAICLSLIYMYLTGRYKRSIILIVVSLSSALFAGSAGVIVGLFSTLFLYCLPNVRNKVRIWWGAGISCVFFIAVVVMRMQYLFKDIIVNILHRDLTFTGRIYIWDAALLMFRKNWLIGNGYYYSLQIPQWVGQETQYASHAHCQLLEVLMQGGIVYLILLCVMLIQLSKGLNKNPNIYSEIIQCSIFGIFVYGLTDIFLTSPLIYIVFLIGFCSSSLQTDLNGKHRKKLSLLTILRRIT